MIGVGMPKLLLVIALLSLFAAGAHGDGSVVDKVYHPYVEQLEWELEWRVTHEDENPITGVERRQLHRLGLGRAVSEYVFAEVYLIGEQSSQESFGLEAYELELLWQLSDQGEYFMDYGVLFELEKEHSDDIWEASSALLLEKEFGRYSATVNLGLTYEWGDDIEDELETAAALQARYRYSPRFEPALEVYLGEDTRAVGPVVMGRERLGQMKALSWEFGVVLGVDSDTADYTVRAVLEYEF